MAREGGSDAVEYCLTEWHDKLCSTCALLNTPDVAFVPFELCLPADSIRTASFQDALSFFKAIGQHALDAFESMAVFDAIVANPDRHPGNFWAKDDKGSKIRT